MHADALAREVSATRWYLDHAAVQATTTCTTCSTQPTAGPGLLHELHADARRKGKRLPAQAYPHALEARYRGQLLRRQRKVHRLLLEAVKSAVAPLREGINTRARADRRRDAAGLAVVTGSHHPADLELAELLVDLRLDSAATDQRKLLAVIAKVQRAVAKASPVQTELLFSLAQQVRSQATASVTKQVLTVVGIDVLPTLGTAGPLLGKWADNNAALIKSLDQRYFDDIRDAVIATVGEGHSTAKLSRAIAERYGVARSRADLIATDQVGSLNAKITQERQTALGIEEYIWDNSGDSRVRPKHRDAPEGLGNTVRRWDTPHPTEGHPGEPVRCRCSALPNLTATNQPKIAAKAVADVPIASVSAPKISPTAPKLQTKTTAPAWTKTSEGYQLKGGLGSGSTLKKSGRTWVLVTPDGNEVQLGKRATFTHAESALVDLLK